MRHMGVLTRMAAMLAATVTPWVKGVAWVDPGVDLSDNTTPEAYLREHLTVEGTVNAYREGDYTITYRTEDEEGNVGTAQRIVKVRRREVL